MGALGRKPFRGVVDTFALAAVWVVALSLWATAVQGFLARSDINEIELSSSLAGINSMHGARSLPLWGPTGAMKGLYGRSKKAGLDDDAWAAMTGQDMSHEMDGYSWAGISSEDLADNAGYCMTPGRLVEIDIGTDRIIGQALAELVEVGEITEQGARASLRYLAASKTAVADILHLEGEPLQSEPVDVHFCAGLEHNEFGGIETDCMFDEERVLVHHDNFSFTSVAHWW